MWGGPTFWIGQRRDLQHHRKERAADKEPGVLGTAATNTCREGRVVRVWVWVRVRVGVGVRVRVRVRV